MTNMQWVLSVFAIVGVIAGVARLIMQWQQRREARQAAEKKRKQREQLAAFLVEAQQLGKRLDETLLPVADQRLGRPRGGISARQPGSRLQSEVQRFQRHDLLCG